MRDNESDNNEYTDPRPYLNPNNGERTAYPHAMSIYAPRPRPDAMGGA